LEESDQGRTDRPAIEGRIGDGNELLAVGTVLETTEDIVRVRNEQGEQVEGGKHNGSAVTSIIGRSASESHLFGNPGTIASERAAEPAIVPVAAPTSASNAPEAPSRY